MDIKGLSKAAVLAVLYNRARPQGMGFLQYKPTPMTEVEAQAIIDQITAANVPFSFDYLSGRVMKVNITNDEVDTWGYNRDNGANAAEEVIAQLRQNGQVMTPDISRKHQESTFDAALEAEKMMTEPTTFKGGVVRLGGQPAADHLHPAVDRATQGRHRR